MTLESIQNYQPKTALETETLSIILGHVEEGYTEEFFDDLENNGCISGLIGDLIYYTDTQRFFNDNKTDINDLIKETLDGIGFDCISELFSQDAFDKEDLLCLEQQNQNLLAWFAFEETARKIKEAL